jgi:serine/threonine-protein kinase
MSEPSTQRSEHLAAGAVIAQRYRVIRLLGSGGMGAVYEAENTWTHRRVALKTMRAEVATSELYLQRFKQEARAASRLAHPNIVDVLDMGEDAELGALYIVQEFLSGCDLRTRLEQVGRLDPSTALSLLLPVMDALATAHKAGIVHRDLKPDNIFLADTARGVVPKLIDFGIAKVVGDDGGSLQKTSTGLVMGTPYYMSPEQARGDSNLGPPADIWSMGVVLYQALSEKRPYSATNINLLLAKIIYEEPLPLAEAAPDLPPALVAVIDCALRKEPGLRHATMTEFAEALRGCDLTAPTAPPALPTTQPAPAGLPSTFSGLDLAIQPASDAVVQPAPGFHARRVVTGFVGFGVVLAAVALFSVARKAPDRPPAQPPEHAPPPRSLPLTVLVAAPAVTLPATTPATPDAGTATSVPGVASTMPSRQPFRLRPASRMNARPELLPTGGASPAVNLLVPRRHAP